LYEAETLQNQRLGIDYIDAEMALDILTLVGRQTQEKLSFRIENLVTSALEYVFENPYQFKVEFDTKNNRTQCELYFERDGFKADPMGDSGGTVLDITSIALRWSMWSLQADRSSPVFVLDEPFKHVSRDYRDRASMFLKEMCTRLGIQVITSTHEDELISGADRVIEIIKDGRYSKIRRSA
jgi:hypothetical protein